MNPERWHRVQRLFEEALARPEEARRTFIISACGSEIELRDEVLALLAALLLVDQADLGAGWKDFVRWAFPSAAILLPAAYFLSVLSPEAGRPNRLVNLAYLGALSLTAGMLTLGFGLLRVL